MNYLSLIKSMCFLLTMAFFTPNAFSQPTGTSLLFNGTNNYVNVPDNAALDFIDSMSMEVWISPISDGILLSKGICLNANYGYHVDIDSGRITFAWNTNGSCAGGIGNGFRTDSAVLPPNQCTHVAIVFNSGEVKIYANGIFAPGSLYIGSYAPIHNSSEPLRIGVYKKVNPVALVGYYNGELDELRFWNYQLDSTEINSRMHSALTGNEPGLVAYYDFEEPGTGTGISILNKCTLTGSILNGTTTGDTISPSHIPRCPTSGVQETLVSGTALIYPNPSNGMFTFDCKNITAMKDHTMLIRNVFSQVVNKRILKQSKTEINLAGILKPGVYFLEVWNHKNERVTCNKIVIE